MKLKLSARCPSRDPVPCDSLGAGHRPTSERPVDAVWTDDGRSFSFEFSEPDVPEPEISETGAAEAETQSADAPATP